MISPMTNYFSQRTNWSGAPNALAEKINSLKKQGREIIDLSVTNPTRCGFHYLQAGLLNFLLCPKNLDYDPDPRGLLTARQAVSDYYRKKNCEVPADRIFLTASTSEAYSFLFRLTANSGDTVLAPEPSYPILEYLAALNDLRLERYPLRYDGHWRIDLKTLEEKMAAFKPKAVLLVHPNNPTGNPVQRDERNAVAAFAYRHHAAVISDEVFLDFAFEKTAREPESFADETGALTFTLSGLSKVTGLPQMKLSWIAAGGPDALREEAISRLEIISDTYLSTGTPVQNALTELLEKQPEIRAEIMARLIENYSHLRQALAGEKAVKLLNAEAGWVAVMECPFDRSDEEWALEFLEGEGLLVHPGYLYDFHESSFVVVSLLTPPETFKKGIASLLSVIKKKTA